MLSEEKTKQSKIVSNIEFLDIFINVESLKILQTILVYQQTNGNAKKLNKIFRFTQLSVYAFFLKLDLLTLSSCSFTCHFLKDRNYRRNIMFSFSLFVMFCYNFFPLFSLCLPLLFSCFLWQCCAEF